MVEILCINKAGGDHDNPYVAISNFRWLNHATKESGDANLAEMVKFVKNGGLAYVQNNYGTRAWLSVRESSRGNEYVQTVADGHYTNNLLSLSECRLYV